MNEKYNPPLQGKGIFGYGEILKLFSNSIVISIFNVHSIFSAPMGYPMISSDVMNTYMIQSQMTPRGADTNRSRSNADHPASGYGQFGYGQFGQRSFPDYTPFSALQLPKLNIGESSALGKRKNQGNTKPKKKQEIKMTGKNQN